MSIKWLTPMKDFHTYPIITKHGIQELLHYKGLYFNCDMVDVSDNVVYSVIWVNVSKNRRAI